MSSQTGQDIVRGFAAGAQAIAVTSSDPRVAIPARGAALILNTVARLMAGRTDEEAQAILERLVNDGAQPISQSELDAQVDKILAEFGITR